MNRFETPQEVFVVTGDFAGSDDSNVVPYAPSYYEVQQQNSPLTPMDFPEHAYAQTKAAPGDTDGYGIDLGGFKARPTTPDVDVPAETDMSVYFKWAETQFDEPLATQSFPADTEEGPEYLGSTGTDYEFTGPPTPTEDAVADFRAWMEANPGSTPAENPEHKERLTKLYDTLDPRGTVAAAAALKAARNAAENRAASMSTPEADPTRTSVIKVSDVLGKVATSAEALNESMDFNSPATDAAAPVQPETSQPVSHRRPSGGKHAAPRGGRHAKRR